MKKSISILTVAALIGGGFSACNTTDENVAPTVTIMAPSAANNPHMSGQNMHIHVDFEDDTELHEVMLSVTRLHDGTEVYHQHGHPDAKTATWEIDTVLTTMMHSDFTFTATATDHDEETTTTTETIHMHPM